jgi:hypothetical protein
MGRAIILVIRISPDLPREISLFVISEPQQIAGIAVWSGKYYRTTIFPLLKTPFSAITW